MAELFRMGLRGVPLLVVCCGLFPRAADAHGIDLHVHVAGDSIRGRALFVGGGPVSGANVTVYAPSGSRLGSAKTDDEGAFTFIPREAVDHRIWVDAGGGHGTQYVVKAAELPGSVTRPAADGRRATDGDLERAIAAAVDPLHKKIDRLQSSIRLQDILGGIGYIVGLTGLWFYCKARRLRQKQRESESTS
jgi:nickel transport protein